jgi:CHAD domain-containing protein
VVVLVSVFIVKSGSPPDEILKGLGEAHSLAIGPRSRETLTYQDTFDWRLHRGGVSMTASGRSGNRRLVAVTLSGQTLEARSEKMPAFAFEIRPGPFQDLVRRLAGPRRLLTKARATWTTLPAAVLNEDEKTVVRLRIREGTARPANGSDGIGMPARLEVIPIKGYQREERRVRRFLEKHFDVEEDERTEVETVFDALGVQSGDYTSSFKLKLEPTLSALDATREIHRKLLGSMLANQEGLVRDWDMEFLHDFRVAIRRARSAISQIKGVFPPTASQHLGKELRWLGRRTGPARDMDVYLFRIPGYRESLPDGADKDLAPLVRLLQEKKATEHKRLQRCLRSARYRHLVEDWDAFANGDVAAEECGPNAQRAIASVASETIWRAFGRVLEKGGGIGPRTPARALHRLRIDCKKLRYLITFFRSLYPAEDLNPIVKELKTLQDHLGEFNDLQVQQEALRSFAEELMETRRGPPATLLAMGQLLGRLEAAQAGERAMFHQHFSQFARPKNRKRFRVLFGPPTSDPTLPEREEMSS